LFFQFKCHDREGDKELQAVKEKPDDEDHPD
jgi:hypothetical protein